MALKCLAVLTFVLIVGDASANKYLRRAKETKGVFPVLEAREEYDLNKREFSKRQSDGLISPDCKPCPPFDPKAAEKGETHCEPGLKPVKRCDAKCGCESWDCVRESCDIWIKANAKNFTGPCLNDATGEVDTCLHRTRVEWNCGCKVKTCEKSCKEVKSKCDPDCSSREYDECGCPTEKCIPFVVPTLPSEPTCERTSDCPNPECAKCVKKKPYGDKCAKQFPKDHVIAVCQPVKPPKSPCDICKNEVSVVTGQDKCGHPKFECEKKPEADENGTCEYCEKSMDFLLPAGKCDGKKEGDKVTLCDRVDPVPTLGPCEPANCDFCTQNAVETPVISRCPNCPMQKCVDLPPKSTVAPAPPKCCSGEKPAGKFEKERDHPKCNKRVCVLDCALRDAAVKCDNCTEMKVPTGKKDDCGCEIHECKALPDIEDVPKGSCKDCLKEVLVPKNPANPECKEMARKCVKKTAVYQIVDSKEDLKIPTDPEDPTGDSDEKKKDLFKVADKETIEKMDPESFLEELEKLPEGEPALLDDDKVVLKKPSGETTPAPGAPTPAPGEEKPPTEFSVVPVDEVKDKPVTKKVFVFIPDTCPAIKKSTECHMILKDVKLCDCSVHKEKVPVEQCEPEKCPTKCIPVTKPIEPEGKCMNIDKWCQPRCEDYNMTKCGENPGMKKINIVEDCAPKKAGEKSCRQRTVTVLITPVVTTIPAGDEDVRCCKEKRTKTVGECQPKQCPNTNCDETCEERHVVKEEDECGCAVYKCVPRTSCPLPCGKCEECKSVLDHKKACPTFKCVPKVTPPPPPCHRYKTEKQEGKDVVLEDECGHPIIEKDCPVQISYPNGCKKRHYVGKVRDDCDCAICKNDECCIACDPFEPKPAKCDECEVKEIDSTNPQCPKEVCKPKKCPAFERPNCPTCEKLELGTDKCNCPTAKCVKTPCKPDKKLRCKSDEKMEVEKNACGCLDYKCVKQRPEECRVECKEGEETMVEKMFMCKEINTPCRVKHARDVRQSLMGVGGQLTQCDEAGNYAARQTKGSVHYCVNPKTGVEIPGTRGPIGTVEC